MDASIGTVWEAVAVVFSGALAGNVTHVAEHVRILRCSCVTDPARARKRVLSTSS